MTEDYSKLSLDRLKKEKAKIEKAIVAKEAETKKDVMAKVAAIARKSGFELADLVSNTGGTTRKAGATRKSTAGRKRKKVAGVRSKVPPKYRNPEDASLTWTGRGKQPVWVRDYVANGGDMDSITIE